MIESNAAVATNVDQPSLSDIAAGNSNDNFGDLVEQFGRSKIEGSVSNILGATLGDLIKDIINRAPLPDFLKDAAGEAIDGAIGDERKVSSPEAEAAVQEEFGDAMDELLEGMMSAADEMMNEEAEGGTEGGVRGRGQGGGGSNWLVALAKAMGDVAGQHLGRSVGLANEISALAQSGGGEGTNQAQAQEMTALQAQMQAETQMFKLAQEAATTIIKSTGEALTTTARKQ